MYYLESMYVTKAEQTNMFRNISRSSIDKCVKRRNNLFSLFAYNTNIQNGKRLIRKSLVNFSLNTFCEVTWKIIIWHLAKIYNRVDSTCHTYTMIDTVSYIWAFSLSHSCAIKTIVGTFSTVDLYWIWSIRAIHCFRMSINWFPINLIQVPVQCI